MNQIDQIKIDLTNFIDCDKFVQYQELQPAVANSSPEIRSYVDKEMNSCSHELLRYLTTKKPNDNGLIKIIRSSVKNIENAFLDTEDREFCYELYYVIGQIVGLDIEDKSITVEQKLLQQLQAIAKSGGFDLDGILPSNFSSK